MRQRRFRLYLRIMRRFASLLVLTVLIVAAVFFVPSFGWDALARHQHDLMASVAAHPVLAASLFVLIYAVTTALSLPHGALQTVAGGLLFGTVPGCILTIVGATTGASILLVIVRHAFAGMAARQREHIPEALRQRLARDGFSYLLALRFATIFPFWLVNLAAAVAGLPLRIFVPATLLGILPASFILSSVGAGVSSVLARGDRPDMSILFSPRVFLPLLALSVLSLLPTLLRRHRGVRA